MQLLAPAGLALLALAIPILLLYMLKLRRKPVQVSSILLWQRLLRDQQANTPWQKLKRNLLLFLQLLILAALAFALARPALPTPVVASGTVIVLLDASASMNATDVSPTRFEAARRAVGTLINSLPGSSQMTLILVGNNPQTLIAAESDKALLRGALATAQPAQSGADWQSAFALASAAARNAPEVITVIVSDGGLPLEGLPALPGEVRYLPIGASDDNLAISALALRGGQLFAEVTNYSAAPRSVLLSIAEIVAPTDLLRDARQLEIPPGESRSVTLENISAGGKIYRARISDPAGDSVLDAFPLDDAAFAVNQDAAARRVLLVSTGTALSESKGNLYLEQLLASLPGIQPFRSLTGEIPPDPFDLYLFDGAYPTQALPGSLLLVNPPPNSLFVVGSSFQPAEMRAREHPLTRYVDWSNVHILQANSVPLPAWADLLIEAEGRPLVFAGETGGRRVAVLTFDLRQSDLPLQVAYPILFSNLINYLVPPAAFDASQSLRPGESLTLAPPPGVEQIVIAAPSGQLYTLLPSAASLAFTNTEEIGTYAVNFLSKDTARAEYFAVNLFDPSESNIRPAETLQIGQTSLAPAAAEQTGLRELWPWLAGLALAVLLIEWMVYHRNQ
ncbi:MAG: BatA and WFA domain-containing protein [Anaerolineales bacterium]